MSNYRNILEDYLRVLDIDVDSVLDIGGGALPVSERVHSFRANDYFILDNRAEIAKGVVKYDEDMNYEFNLNKKFDIVFCLEVFEYIFDPIIAMGNISRHLKYGGFALVSFPSIYPLHNPEGIDYLRYTKEGIQKLADESCLRIRSIEPRRPLPDSLMLLQNFYSMEGMHPRKGTQDIYDLGYIVRFVKDEAV